MFKRIFFLLIGIGISMQLTGCFFEGHDDRWHHDHDRVFEHPEHHDDAVVDVHLHG